MKLLIVDDQVTVVEGLREEIPWAAIGISEVYSAYSALQAQQILTAQNIDIMLCDIEMPGEDGLSLVSWLRGQKKEVCVILLTAHAKFAYAQESVKLGVFDYILQPAPYSKIEATVQQAIQHVQAARAEKQLSLYGQEYIQKERTVVSAVLWSWLAAEHSSKELERLEQQAKIPRREDTLLLCLVQVLRWKKASNWEPELFCYALQNIMDEIFQPFDQNTVVVPMQKGEYAVFLWGDGYGLTLTGVQGQMAFFQRVCLQYFQCEMAIYLRRPDKTARCRQMWDDLCALRDDNVSREARIVLQQGDTPQKNYRFSLPQIHEWVSGLQGEYPELVEKEAVALLDRLTDEGKMCAQVLRDFHQDFMQVLHLAVGSGDALWNETIDQPQNYEIYRSAPNSVEEMRRFIRMAVGHLKEKNETPEKELLRKVDAYIDDHISEDIQRSELARSVYRSPDYLNRMFKQITGYSLMEYVTLRKLELARRLLRTTRLPVNIIALRVGFSQLSHFSSSYKKQFGCTPMQERRET